MATANATTTATATNKTASDAQSLEIDTKLVQSYYDSLIQANQKVGARTALKSWDQLGLRDDVELICAGKTCTVVRDRTSYLGWVQFAYEKKLYQTMASCETAMREKKSGGSMDSFRIQFSKDKKTYAISIAKLRAGLLNSYISENLKSFDIIKLASEKSETKVVGEKTKASLRASQEALKKSEETKLAALRKVAEQEKLIQQMQEQLAKLSK